MKSSGYVEEEGVNVVIRNGDAHSYFNRAF